MKDIEIVKASGEREKFDSGKLENSLLKSGSTPFVAHEIVEDVESWIKDGTTTQRIYEYSFKQLNKKSEISSALHYSMKRSLLSFGPSGFPFEKFIAEIFRAKGYQTKTGEIMKGKCIDHEVDVVAYDNDELIIAEVKFHNELGIKVDSKTALYVKARFDDLSNQEFVFGEKTYKPSHAILITNTSFTDNARNYGNCDNNLIMISWDYPKRGNLYDLIDETNIHPISVLPGISNSQKRDLMERGAVTCNSISEHINDLRAVGLKQKDIDKIVKEAETLCSHPSSQSE